MKLPQRNLSIDIAKGIGIMVVVFAHNMDIYAVNRYLFPFAVPFFFFMGGYNFNLAKHRLQPLSFIKIHFLRLLVPYFAASVCSYLFYTAAAPLLSLPPITVDAAIDGVLTGYIGDLEFNIVLWFLPALFFADIFFLALGYKLKGLSLFAAVMLLTAAGWMLGKYDQFMIFSLDIAMTVQLFVYAGYMIRQSQILDKILQYTKNTSLPFLATPLAFLPFLAVLACSAHQKLPDIPTRDYSHPVLFFVAGFCGSGLIILLSSVIAASCHRFAGRVLGAIGRASLDILIAHIPIFSFLASLWAIFYGYGIHYSFSRYWHLHFLLGIAIPAVTHLLFARMLNLKFAQKHPFY